VDSEELRARVAARYGVSIDRRTLAALTRDGRLQRPDIEVLEAIALILQIPVDDLLDVRAVEPDEATSDVSDDVLLDAERDARLRALAEQRDWGEHPLSGPDERALETLIAEAGRALVERDLTAAAQHLDLPADVARAYVAMQTADASRFWSELIDKPERMAAEVRVAKARRQMRAG
jgi:transcriptional regulator with XRE-family HTH domain